MVDPFFTTGNNQQDSGKNVDENTTNQTIEDLMSQQQQIQEKYKELKNLLVDENLSQNQIEEIKEQMQKLSDLYSKNKKAIAGLSTNIEGEKEIHVNKDINTTNSNAKSFSFKKFMIGCGILLLLFLGGLVAVFYALIKNPSRLEAIGLRGCDAVNLLQIFSIVFFGLLFMGGLILFLINLNKLITTKNKRKIQYAFGSLLSFILMIIVAALLVTMINRLSAISENCEDLGNTQLVHSYVNIKDNKFKAVTNKKTEEFLYLIAPINVSYTLNQTEYKNEISKNLGSARITNVELDCGNGQRLLLGADNQNFQNTCFYTKKGSYQPALVINYMDTAGLPQEYTKDIQLINIASEISISSEQTKVEPLNSSLLVGKNPVRLRFDAASVFRDFNISNYNIRWCSDCLCDGSRDNIGSVEYNHEYLNEGVFDVCVSFPALGDQVYTFPIRVDQGTAISDITVSYEVSTNNSDMVYSNPESIELTELPTTLTLQITNITPDLPTIQKKLYKDGQLLPSQFLDPNLFKVTIDDDKTQTLTLELTDADRQLKTEKSIAISINKKTIIGTLLISPQTVGTSPFTITLDASTTTLNDPNDEIVRFSWDFGDGNINKDTSTSIVSHTYEYDFASENGVFYPSVELRTKNGLTYTISGTIINVKKPDTVITISLDEHPAQLAKVGEDVPMSVNIDGMPKKLYRDFGNGDTLECEGRSCAETTHTYLQEGAYSISVRAEFEDKQSLEGKINLLVQ